MRVYRHTQAPSNLSRQARTLDNDFFKSELKQLFLFFSDTNLPTCEAECQPACLEDNFSVLGNTTKSRLQASLNSLVPVLNTSCSVNLKKLACFVETAPCVNNDGSTLHACQSLCEEVRLNCGEEFKRHRISFPPCIPNYPETSTGNGLCHLSHWPAPWPTKLKQNPGLFNTTISKLPESQQLLL